MNLALLMGNRFSAWHLRGLRLLRGGPRIVAFRADSEIQRRFQERDDGTAPFAVEPVYFDTQAGPMPRRVANAILSRYGLREPRLVPFHDRLAGFDLIQTWELFTDWSAEAATARERFGVPVSVMVWDNIPFNMEQSEARRANKRRVLAAADRFIVYTERSRRMLLIEGAPEARIRYVPPGVDASLFAPGPSARRRFGLPDSAFVIAFVGWFLPRKGVDFLLLALHALRADPALRGLDVRLLLVGSGPGTDRVERLIERLGLGAACHFSGSLPYNEMPDVYRSADVFALPSIATAEWQEQFGMAMLEAMACAVPVIATWTGAVPEILSDTGVLCQPNDWLALAGALRELALAPSRRTALGAAGRERVLRCFSLDEHARVLSDLYDELLAIRRTPG